MHQSAKPHASRRSTSKARHSCCTMPGMWFRASHSGGGCTGNRDQQLGRCRGAGLPGRRSHPVELVEQIVARIAGTIDVPVTMDFEGGYSDDDQVLAANVFRLLALGVVGMNFEDRVVQGVGLYAVDSRRTASRDCDAADKQGVNLFINARTDVFLGQQGDPAQSSARLWTARRRTPALVRPASSFLVCRTLH